MRFGLNLKSKDSPSRLPPRVVVAHLGAGLSYAIPAAFERSGKLERFYTDTYIGDKPWLRALLGNIPAALRTPDVRRWMGRQSPDLRSRSVTSFDLFGIAYKWRVKSAGDANARFQIFAAAGAEFNQKIIRQGGWRTADVVWAFNSAALELFEAAKEHGILRILDQNLAPHRVEGRLLEEEIALWPRWQRERLPDRDNPLIHRQEREWRIADRIVAPSRFVLEGLKEVGVPAEKCAIIPYPIDLSRFLPVKRPPLGGRKLRVLFVGTVELRKGVQYLLEALRDLSGRCVEARIVGPIRLQGEIVDRYSDVAEFSGAVPRMEMNRHFDWADVFVFPTLCEGCALVHLEALASGIPVVTTAHCGSVVRDGIDGEIVPIRSSEAIVRALEHYISDPSYLSAQQHAAESGRHRLGFERYADQLNKLVDSIHVTA